MRERIPATFFAEYQALRGQLMEILTDDDLACRIAGNPSLGELCREIGEVEHCYIESFKTFELDFAYRNADPRLETSVAALSAWYAELDRELNAAIVNLTDDQVANRTIDRADFPDWKPLPAAELDNYREALLIFYAKARVYLRALGRKLPEEWHVWIG